MDKSQEAGVVAFRAPDQIENAIGRALKEHRLSSGQAIRELGTKSGVSSAMISRIENGQVSPSLTTLEALANALEVPVVALFQQTVRFADVNLVRAGEGILAKRYAPGHTHDYRMLANFSNSGQKFSAVEVTLSASGNGTHPVYYSRGFVFLTPLAGRCVYLVGAEEYEIGVGDSLSFDAQLRHGALRVLTETFTFVSVAAMIA